MNTNTMIRRKISIVGNSGAGKSFFAKMLSEKSGIPLYTVDTAYWIAGWKLRDEDSFDETHDEWLKNEAWIIDGVGYWSALEKRLEQSNLVFFLDYPVETCLKRAELRIEKEKLLPNSDIATGCRYADVHDLQIRTIMEFHNTYRPKLMNLLKIRVPGKVIVISSQEELDKIFTSIGDKQWTEKS